MTYVKRTPEVADPVADTILSVRAGGPARYGDWMQTYTGRMFWPLDARPEEVDIDDIAHALSNCCRYGGHCENFYSVAEHSVLCSRVVPPEFALQALLHDATEAYLVDVPRPIKRFLTNYAQIEAALARVIGDRFGLDLVNLDATVHAADNNVLLAEAEQIMKPHPSPWSIPGAPADVMVACMPPKDAKAFFLARFEELTRHGRRSIKQSWRGEGQNFID